VRSYIFNEEDNINFEDNFDYEYENIVKINIDI